MHGCFPRDPDLPENFPLYSRASKVESLVDMSCGEKVTQINISYARKHLDSKAHEWKVSNQGRDHPLQSMSSV